MKFLLFVLYVIASVAEDVLSLASRLINRFVFRGSRHQTTSSRAHMQHKKSKFWAFTRCLINWIFIWQEDHCKGAWEEEVKNALRTIQINTELVNGEDV